MTKTKTKHTDLKTWMESCSEQVCVKNRKWNGASELKLASSRKTPGGVNLQKGFQRIWVKFGLRWLQLSLKPGSSMCCLCMSLQLLCSLKAHWWVSQKVRINVREASADRLWDQTIAQQLKSKLHFQVTQVCFRKRSQEFTGISPSHANLSFTAFYSQQRQVSNRREMLHIWKKGNMLHVISQKKQFLHWCQSCNDSTKQKPSMAITVKRWRLFGHAQIKLCG